MIRRAIFEISSCPRRAINFNKYDSRNEQYFKHVSRKYPINYEIFYKLLLNVIVLII